MPSTEVATPLRRRRAALITLAFAFAWAGATIPVAGAQEPGVIYEPGSPSAKEYAIPLEEARRDAGAGSPSGDNSRPFGIGISRRRARAAAERRQSSAGADSGRSDASKRSSGGDSAGERAADSPALEKQLADAEDAGAPALWSVWLLLLVLLPGLIVGLLLARRSGREPLT